MLPPASEMIGSAGFLVWKPIIPDRAAFGTAAQHQPHGDHTSEQGQSTKHSEKILPVATSSVATPAAIIRPEACYFQARNGLVWASYWALNPEMALPGRPETIHEDGKRAGGDFR
jgi:hypothetical protein